MDRRRPGAVSLGASFLTLTLVGFGVIAALLLFPDPLSFYQEQWQALERRLGPSEVRTRLARRFHWTGDGEPCLRYRPMPASEEQVLELADRLVQAGQAPLAERLFHLVRAWEAEHQRVHHLLDAAEERLRLLEDQLDGLPHLVLRLNRSRLLRALRAERANARAEAVLRQRSLPPLSAVDEARARGLFKRHKRTFAAALQRSMEIAEGDSITAERMQRVVRALKRWVALTGAPPGSLEGFPLELRDDGFGSPFYYERSARSVWLISTGGDGLWGTADDRIWGLDH